MSDDAIGAGVSREQIETALADPAFASLRLAGAPVVVVASAPGRVVYASAEAEALFGGDLAALTRRLLHGGEPGAQRVISLARSLLPGAAPRLERLRFFFGPVAETVTVLCRRVSIAQGGSLFALAVLGVRAPAQPAPKPASVPALSRIHAQPTAADIAPPPVARSEQRAPIEEEARPFDGTESPTSVQSAEAALPARESANIVDGQPLPDEPRPTRFVWRTDSDHVFTAIASAFVEIVGDRHAQIIGRSFVDLARELGLDPQGKLVAALAARDTFAGVQASWPVGDGAARASVTFGAAPTFGADDQFEGYRGFGLIHPARIARKDGQKVEPSESAAGAGRECAAPAPAVGPSPNAMSSVRPPASEAPESDDPESDANRPPATRSIVTEPIVKEPVVTEPTAPGHVAPGAANPIADDIAEPFDAIRAALARASEEYLAHRAARSAAASNGVGGRDIVSGKDAERVVSVTDGGVPLYGEESDYAPATAETGDEDDGDEIYLIGGSELDDDLRVEHPPAVETSSTSPGFGKVVPLRPPQTQRAAPEAEAATSSRSLSELSPNEKNAFDEIARALGAEPPKGASPDARRGASNKRARDLIDLVARFGRSQESQSGAPAPADVMTAPLDAAAASPGSAPESANAAAASAHAPSGADTTSVATPAVAPRLDPFQRNALAMVDRMPVGIVVSAFNVAIYANRTLLDLLDYPDVDAFHAAGGLDKLLRGVASDGGAAQIEARDGEVMNVDARVQAIEWDGQPATLVTLRRAVESPEAPRAKALELELRQRDSEARELHAILDTATDGVAVLDADGRILSLNRSGEALFGYDQNEVAGEHFTVLVAPESHDVIAQYFDGVRPGGVASVLNDGREIMGRARQGGTIPVFMTLGRLGSGASPKFCAVMRDLTAWKKVERDLGDARREAERASALKSDFLAKISHEIRTPLNAILGFAEVIMDEQFGPVGNARYRDYMRDIHKSGEHVLSLVNDLLDLSKIEAGKVDLTFTSVDANAIVNECVSLMQTQAARARVVMRQSLAPNLPNIVADERSMRQIVLNLLSNAVKFTEAGGQVIVSTALTDAGHAVVRIKDTGIGMSDSELETALQPFRQIATTRKTEGTGLGLPLTKALVEANRASFTIKSRKNEGTLVEVTFPPTRVLAE